ncbi:hypothetical protein CH063_08386 [Colletotrichum higginsianum]|uniref:Secreted protein n=1 Tax=Colletotrichum higginsianum (strain IMI 349063) TaxID=759273 RepID=H1V9M9_COLHI|nr:hypothetical protein CH063_08386 [Colletotrichum higginsianum]
MTRSGVCLLFILAIPPDLRPETSLPPASCREREAQVSPCWPPPRSEMHILSCLLSASERTPHPLPPNQRGRPINLPTYPHTSSSSPPPCHVLIPAKSTTASSHRAPRNCSVSGRNVALPDLGTHICCRYGCRPITRDSLPKRPRCITLMLLALHLQPRNLEQPHHLFSPLYLPTYTRGLFSKHITFTHTHTIRGSGVVSRRPGVPICTHGWLIGLVHFKAVLHSV